MTAVLWPFSVYIVVTSCELRTVDRLERTQSFPGSIYNSLQLNAIPQEVNSTDSASDSTAKRPPY